MSARNRGGYTMIELLVTVMIIGILAAYGVPQYLRTVETGKADDAVSVVNMIGSTNKMFALDHGGAFVYGPLASACGAGICPTLASPPPANVSGACVLVWCKYLADQDWANKPYQFNACDPNSGMGGGACAAGLVSSAKRSPTAYSPYNAWGYTVNTAGQIVGNPGAPPPTY